jgi:hypothetical protein
MLTASGERDPVGLLAEDFLDREHRGERPTLQEHLDRRPAPDDLRRAKSESGPAEAPAPESPLTSRR